MPRPVILAIAIVLAAASGVHAEVPPAIMAPPGAYPSMAPVLKMVSPGVVRIDSVRRTAQGRRVTLETRNNGSGVVYDAAEGLIVTNNHVIDRADEITVTLADGRAVAAKLVGGDSEFDLAVVRVRAENLTPFVFADSGEVQVGDFVLAIGYPGRFGQSVTSGIVSGLHRSNLGVGRFENFIQTDAAIYPGNSGGALVNLRGELVGINTLYIGASSTNPGMGFAISSNTARMIADQIVRFGDVRRGSLGITTDDPDPNAMKPSVLKSGAVVTTVAAGSSAEQAGLRAGDIVTQIGSREVLGSAFLRHRLALLRVGEVAELGVWRNGRQLVIRATVAAQRTSPK
jgi:serine protease DegQ